MTRTADPFRVVVVGGGFAAPEAVLAPRAYMQKHVAIELVAPLADAPAARVRGGRPLRTAHAR